MYLSKLEHYNITADSIFGFIFLLRYLPDISAIQHFCFPVRGENNKCFKCHGQEKYEYTNETLGRQVTELMCANRIVHKDEFLQSNHKSFACTDCHSADYEKFPHAGELRMEEKFNCLDCHGGDENYAKYHFEEIDAEYQQSIHFKASG